MRASTKRILVLTTGVLGFMVVALGVAWACTVQAGVTDLSPNDPDPGQVITVTGNEYHPNATIELHWGGDSGRVIGSTTADASGVFTAEGTVPADAEPGEHLLVAMDPNETTPGHGRGVVMVNVGGEQPEPEPEPAPVNAEPEPEPAQEPEPAPESSNEAPHPDPAPANADAAPAPAPHPPAPHPAPEPSAAQAPAPEPAPQPADASEAPVAQPEAPPQEGGAEPAEGAAAEEAAATEPSVDPADEAGSEEASEPDFVPRPQEYVESPSPRSATGDLWSGVAPSDAPSLTPEPGYDAAADAARQTPGQLAAGLALLGAGFMLLAGAAIPALRRRVPARARATRSD